MSRRPTLRYHVARKARRLGLDRRERPGTSRAGKYGSTNSACLAPRRGRASGPIASGLARNYREVRSSTSFPQVGVTETRPILGRAQRRRPLARAVRSQQILGRESESMSPQATGRRNERRRDRRNRRTARHRAPRDAAAFGAASSASRRPASSMVSGPRTRARLDFDAHVIETHRCRSWSRRRRARRALAWIPPDALETRSRFWTSRIPRRRRAHIRRNFDRRAHLRLVWRLARRKPERPRLRPASSSKAPGRVSGGIDVSTTTSASRGARSSQTRSRHMAGVY